MKMISILKCKNLDGVEFRTVAMAIGIKWKLTRTNIVNFGWVLSSLPATQHDFLGKF